MGAAMQRSWDVGVRVCTSFPRSQFSDGLKARDHHDTFSIRSLAVRDGMGTGRAEVGRCYNHLRWGWEGAECSGWGSRTGDIWGPGQSSVRGGRDKRKTQLLGAPCSSTEPGTQLCEKQRGSGWGWWGSNIDRFLLQA